MQKKSSRKTINVKRHVHAQAFLISMVFMVVLVLLHQTAGALSPADAAGTINDAAMKLVRFCVEPKTGLDEGAVATLVDYVLNPKQARERGLPKSKDCTGAYYEFDTRIPFSRFIEYSYNSHIPPAVTRPSSLRYSTWTAPQHDMQKLPQAWKPVPPGGTPVIIHGIEHDSNTPDVNTGVYHEYEMKRTLIHLNHKGRQAMISISKQLNTSKVGKKGVILGNDYDWNYYYSGEIGNAVTGLGWAKSYIYDYFSLSVFVEPSTSPTAVRTGVFQWLRAGWSGINFVRESHILGGLKRFGRDCKTILESPRLPSTPQMISAFQRLSNLSESDLMKEYNTLRQAQHSLAIQTGKISKTDGEDKVSTASISRDQMIEELMLENLKTTLGKPALVSR